MRTTRRKALVLAAAVAAMTAAGCSSSSSDASGEDETPTLTVGMPVGPQTENHNPFLNGTSAAAQLGYRYMIYEPLAVPNAIEPTEPAKPWLATEWSWNDAYDELTLQVREGVTWSDGQDLTAEDVGFTFEMVRDNDALNGGGTPYQDVTVTGNSVVLTFPGPQLVNENNILQTFVVPEHVWSTVDDPATFTAPQPVGSGPYTLTSFTPQNVTLDRRDGYWQDAPEVEQLRYTAYNDNTATTTALANGDVEWSWVSIPNFESVYLDRDRDHHRQWTPSTLGVNGLWLNSERAPLNDRALRQAISLVVDRAEIVQTAEYDTSVPVTSPTGIPLPTGESFLSDEFTGEELSPDPEAARQLLTGAGYTYSAEDELLDPTGAPVTFPLSGASGFSNYLTGSEIIIADLAEIGIDATLETQPVDTWIDDFNTGNFAATLHWTNGGFTPFDMYRNVMDGGEYKPIGESANNNQGRFRNAAADQALGEYAAATDEATRTAALDTLQRVFAEEVPMVATFSGTVGGQYSTKNWEGWPDEDDPYASPQPVQINSLDVVLTLRRAG